MDREVFSAHEAIDEEAPEGRMLLAQAEHPGPRVEPAPPLFHHGDQAHPVRAEPAPPDDEENHEPERERQRQAHPAKVAKQERHVPSREDAEKAPDDGDEPSDDQRRRAMLIEECPRPRETALVEAQRAAEAVDDRRAPPR